MFATILLGAAGLAVGSLLNRLIVREPGYVIVDPGDLPEGADPALLDELEEPPDLDAPVPVLAVLRPGTWWRKWFPIVEVVTGVLFALTAHRLGIGLVGGPVLFLIAALVTLAAIDFRVYRLPDKINLPSAAVGLVLIAAASLADGRPGAIASAAVGGVVYSGMLFLAHLVYPRGMGFGDVKLAWLMGFFLGWMGWEATGDGLQFLLAIRFVLFGAALGSVYGVVVGGAYALVRRTAKVVFPYGPSLAAGCLTVVLFADTLR